MSDYRLEQWQEQIEKFENDPETFSGNTGIKVIEDVLVKLPKDAKELASLMKTLAKLRKAREEKR